MDHTPVFTNVGKTKDHQFAFSGHKLPNTQLLANAKRSFTHSIALAIQPGKITYQPKVAIKYLSLLMSVTGYHSRI